MTKTTSYTTSKGEVVQCPRCGAMMTGFPALSRRDNRTDICSECGILEAMEDYTGDYYKGEPYWVVQK